MPHLHKAGQSEKFIEDSSPSSTNNKIFGVRGTQLTTAAATTPINEYAQTNTSVSSIEPPLISMIDLVNNIATSSSQHNRSKKRRSKKSRSPQVKQSFQSDSDPVFVGIRQNMAGIRLACMQFRSYPTIGIRLKGFRQLTAEIRPRLFGSDGIRLGIIDLGQHSNNFNLPPAPLHTSFSTMMNNSIGMEPIHHSASPPMYPSHHPMQSNDIRPPAPPPQQQHLTEEEEIRNLAEALKQYPPRK